MLDLNRASIYLRSKIIEIKPLMGQYENDIVRLEKKKREIHKIHEGDDKSFLKAYIVYNLAKAGTTSFTVGNKPQFDKNGIAINQIDRYDEYVVGGTQLKKLITIGGSKYFSFETLVTCLKKDKTGKFDTILPTITRLKHYINDDNDITRLRYEETENKEIKINKNVDSEYYDDYDDDDTSKSERAFSFTHERNSGNLDTFVYPLIEIYDDEIYIKCDSDLNDRVGWNTSLTITLNNILQSKMATVMNAITNEDANGKFESKIAERFEKVKTQYHKEMFEIKELLMFADEYVLLNALM